MYALAGSHHQGATSGALVTFSPFRHVTCAPRCPSLVRYVCRFPAGTAPMLCATWHMHVACAGATTPWHSSASASWRASASPGCTPHPTSLAAASAGSSCRHLPASCPPAPAARREAAPPTRERRRWWCCAGEAMLAVALLGSLPCTVQADTCTLVMPSELAASRLHSSLLVPGRLRAVLRPTKDLQRH